MEQKALEYDIQTRDADFREKTIFPPFSASRLSVEERKNEFRILMSR